MQKKFDALRAQAEKILKESPASASVDFDTMAMSELLHELSIYQAEIQAQNESLHEALENNERLIQQQQKQYADLYANNSVGMLTLDDSLKVIDVNERFCQMMGLAAKFLTDRFLSSLLLPADYSDFLSLRLQVLDGRKNVSIQVQLVTTFKESKQRLPVQLSLTPLEQLNGDLNLNVAVMDISQLRENELLLKERKKLQNVIDSTNVGTWEWNTQTGETVFNEKWAAIIGYTLDELRPISIDTWVKNCHEDDLAKSNNALQSVFAGETDHYECELRMRHRHGHWVWVIDQGAVIEWDAKGKPLVMAGTHYEITNRKQQEVRLEQLVVARNASLSAALSKAQDANLAKSRFLSNMSHELRTPMHAIRSFVDLAVKDLKTIQHTDKVLGFLDKASQSAERLTNLLNLLLDLSRLESGKMPMSARQLDLVNLLDSALLPMKLLADKKSQTLITQSPPSLQISLDASLFEQLIVNIVGNAIKYSPEGTNITVSLTLIVAPQTGVRLAITDEGVGFPAEELSHVFDRFYQTSRTDRGAGGTGLGMAITKQIVDMHFGKIWIESPPAGSSVGSTVFVELPDQQILVKQKKSIRPADKVRVLLVDDDPMVLGLIKRFLIEDGFEVQSAHSGVGIQKRVLEFDPDLLLTDILMPDQDGITTLNQALAVKPNLHVVTMSSDDLALKLSSHGDSERCFIEKPIDRNNLLEMIHSCLQKNAGES